MADKIKIVNTLEMMMYQYRETNYGRQPKYVTISYDDYRDLETVRLRDYSEKQRLRFQGSIVLKSPNLESEEIVLSDEKIK